MTPSLSPFGFCYLLVSFCVSELGINFKEIWAKTVFVMIPNKQLSKQAAEDVDLAGPLLFCMMLGGLLLLVYRFFFFACSFVCSFVCLFVCVFVCVCVCLFVCLPGRSEWLIDSWYH